MNNTLVYRVQRKIPTLHLDKDLLKKIELYIFKHMPNLCEIPENEVKENYSITITEQNSSLILKSIDFYELEVFPNQINEVVIKLHAGSYSKGLGTDLRLVFSNQFSSKLDLELKSQYPKEIANGLVVKLEEIMNQKKSINYLFHPSLLKFSLIMAFFLLYFLLDYFTRPHGIRIHIVGTLLSISIFFYTSIFAKLKPYISFDTNKQRRNDTIANNLLIGFILFVVFTVTFGPLVTKLF